MTSKDEILKSIRAQHTPATAAPELVGDWLRYADPFAQFASMVESVGGRCVRVASVDEIKSLLPNTQGFSSDARVVSKIPGIVGTVDLDQVLDPHDLANVDGAVMPGHFGVAENGAVWVTDLGVKQRAIYFITQHLALVIPAAEIVHNMHEAYRRVSLAESSFGVFISGPSKTADIEQSLVIGAHGARSLTVFCVG